MLTWNCMSFCFRWKCRNVPHCHPLYFYYFPSDWVVFSSVETWHVTIIYISMSKSSKFISGKYGRCVISFSILIFTFCICPTRCNPRENKTLIRIVTDYLWIYTCIGLINLKDGLTPCRHLWDWSNSIHFRR